MKLNIINPEVEKPSILLRAVDQFIPINSLNYYIKSIFISKNKNCILFKENGIQISNQKAIIPYNKLEDFKFHFNQLDYNNNRDYKKYSFIEFNYSNQTLKFHFVSNKFIVKKILQHLYSQQVNFKEYKNDQRVFLGKKKSYQEVQELKNKYKIDW